MALKMIPQAKKDAAVQRILAGQSTVSDEARRLNCTPQVVRRWRKDYLIRHPEAKPPEPKEAPSPPPPPESEPAATLDGGLDAARGGAGFDAVVTTFAGGPVTQTSPARPAVEPAIVSTREEDEALTFFYAGLLVSGEIRVLLKLYSWRKPWRLILTPELEAKCLLTEGEKQALRPAAPLIARKIRETTGSSDAAMLVGAIVALGWGTYDRFEAVAGAAAAARERYKAETEKR